MFHNLPGEIMRYNFPREIISRLVRILLQGMVSDKTPDWDMIPSQGGTQVATFTLFQRSSLFQGLLPLRLFQREVVYLGIVDTYALCS